MLPLFPNAANDVEVIVIVFVFAFRHWFVLPPLPPAGATVGSGAPPIEDGPPFEVRGESGLFMAVLTTVSLVLERPGFTNPIRIELTRQEIVIKDVSYAAFIAPSAALTTSRRRCARG